MNKQIFVLLIILSIALGQDYYAGTTTTSSSPASTPTPGYKGRSENRDRSDRDGRYTSGFKSATHKHAHIFKWIGLIVTIGLLTFIVKKVKRNRRLRAQQRQARQNLPMGFPVQIPHQAAQPQFYAVPVEQYDQFQRWLQLQQIAPQPTHQVPVQQQAQMPVHGIQQGQPFFQPQQGQVQYPQFQNHFEIQQPIRQ
ncbi:hypothetical protein pb186bvf_010833 [Paramecium bursaria]